MTTPAAQVSMLEIFQRVTGRDEVNYNPDDPQSESDAELIKRISNALYGNVGANLDARDWDVILAQPNPLEAAEKGLAAMYSDPSYQAVNLAYVVAQDVASKGKLGYTVDVVNNTYRQMVNRVGAVYTGDYLNTDLGREVQSIINSKNDGVIREYAKELVDTAIPTLSTNVSQAITPSFSIPADLVDASPVDKAKFYAARRAEGFTNEQIRGSIELVFGKQSDSDWSALQTLAAPFMVTRVVTTAQVTDTVTTTPVTDTVTTTTTTTPGGKTTFFVPVNITSFTNQQKVDFYRAKRAEGFTDAQIRSTIEMVIGPQSDTDWSALRAAAFASTSTTTVPVTPEPAGAGIGPLVLAVAAAYFLGA